MHFLFGLTSIGRFPSRCVYVYCYLYTHTALWIVHATCYNTQSRQFRCLSISYGLAELFTFSSAVLHSLIDKRRGIAVIIFLFIVSTHNKTLILIRLWIHWLVSGQRVTPNKSLLMPCLFNTCATIHICQTKPVSQDSSNLGFRYEKRRFLTIFQSYQQVACAPKKVRLRRKKDKPYRLHYANKKCRWSIVTHSMRLQSAFPNCGTGEHPMYRLGTSPRFVLPFGYDGPLD